LTTEKNGNDAERTAALRPSGRDAPGLFTPSASLPPSPAALAHLVGARGRSRSNLSRQ